jgi:hypothetical protein
VAQHMPISELPVIRPESAESTNGMVRRLSREGREYKR